MRKVIAFILAVALLYGCAAHRAPLPAIPFNPIATVSHSIARLAHVADNLELDSCTAYSIGDHKFLTAEHCLTLEDDNGFAIDAPLTADGLYAITLKKDAGLDLAIISVDEDKPKVTFRDTPLAEHEILFALGYASGLRAPTLTEHTLKSMRYSLGHGIALGNIYTEPFIPGMSGGPVFDMSGKVVGICQRTNRIAGYGVDRDTIRTFLST